MRFLITGGCGFLGSNLASEVIKRGEELFVLDSLYRKGSEQNLEWLQSLGKFEFFKKDVRSYSDCEEVVRQVKPDVVFHVAGQVAMTTSLSNPRYDFETNALGSFNILEALRRHAPNAIIVYSSTNKVYGDLEHVHYREDVRRYSCPEFPNGLPETIPLDFRTPYGCSKGSADQYIKDAWKCYDQRTIVFRHSSIYGGRQFSTYDQGWIGWFVEQAVCTARSANHPVFTISGNGKQVRDVLFASDLIQCYFNAISHIDRCAGEVFNIGGGFSNSLSILELFDLLEQELSIKLRFEVLASRKSDQKYFVADIEKAQKLFGWKPVVDKHTGIRKMIQWVGEIL